VSEKNKKGRPTEGVGPPFLVYYNIIFGK